MKRKTGIVSVGILIALMWISTAHAMDMYGFFLEKHRKVLPAIIHNCLFDGDDIACVSSLREMVQAEAGLVSYGKNYLDKDLYSRLSNDLNDLQYREFAWRLLEERLADNNCMIEPAGSVFP